MIKLDTMPNYQPSKTILKRYAHVLINFALNSGQGVKPGEVVLCLVPDVAKPLALELQNSLLKAKAHPLIRLLPTEFSQDFYSLANQDQLTFFPKKYLKAQVDLIDHRIAIIADVNPQELKNVNPKKIILARDAKKSYKDWLISKEIKGKLTWTVALWATPAKAKLVSLSYPAYWQQIINACFLDKPDPITHWQKIVKLQKNILKKINALKIKSLHMTGKDMDLKITLGADRQWQGGSGRNIPSFEIFTSPDWRGTQGWIRFNQPLYRYGNIIKNISLEFNRGQVVKASAKQGNHLLQEMLKSPNAGKLGEFSLTDKRLSRITHIMAETLFDENIGGPYGNAHIAIGMSYKDCYRGDPKKLTKKDWQVKGFNDSAEHTDMMTTTNRTVTATLINGQKKLIYKQGQFTL